MRNWSCPYCGGYTVPHQTLPYQGTNYMTYRCIRCEQIGLPMWLKAKPDMFGQLYLEAPKPVLLLAAKNPQ